MSRADSRYPTPFPPRGFSLLEVILALAILVGAMAVLGELARNGLDSTRIARDTTVAQLLCESKLDEITSGMIDFKAVSRTPYEKVEVSDGGDWLYSIDIEPTNHLGLVVLRVTVEQDMPPKNHPVVFSLTRWILDPDAETTEEES